MKVVLISKTLTKGGAASGARNLLGALRAAGADVVALDGYAGLAARPARLVRVAERACERICFDAESHFLRFGPPTFDLAQVYDKYRPDVIQLCDVSGNTIRFADIARVPCPVVHRLSDFWPYHGARHYALSRPCPPGFADKLLHRFIFDGHDIPACRVAPSHWLASRLGGRDIRVIRNSVASPSEVKTRRALSGRVRFGFIAAHVMDKRKGFSALPPFMQAMAKQLPVSTELHVYGHVTPAAFPVFEGVKLIFYPAFTKADLARVYESFDVLLCPSRLDNSPNVVTEAMAHGVPVIGQSDTGMESYIARNCGALVDFHTDDQEQIRRFVAICDDLLSGYGACSANAIRYARGGRGNLDHLLRWIA